MKTSFATRLTLAFALLLLAYGAIVAVLGRHLEAEYEAEASQRLAYGLAQHIVGRWPEATGAALDGDDAARTSLLNMLAIVNPGVEVYMLDAEGRVDSYIGEPGMVRRYQVDLDAVRAFLGGAALPLRGTDPKTERGDKVFSAAMFPPRAGDTRPPGYLYVVLEGQARAQVAGPLGLRRAWQTASVAAALALFATLALGAFAFRRLTGPLHALARRMREFNIAATDSAAPPAATAHDAPRGDEVASIAASFDAMKARIEQQLRAQAVQDAAHREVMAGVAHDLRTPLTALHGHLEALALPGAAMAPNAQRLADVALAQSEKVRRLTQQLFELATLQTMDHVLHRDRFRLDELVADTVQKFELARPAAAVALSGPPPGRVEMDGDLQLIERALTNLIDNALRHAGSDEPVRVSLQCDGARASVLIEDDGPGLPQDIAQRLNSGQGVREPPLRRPGGGIGGLGLAIAQRIALLHGGRLNMMPAPGGGTRLSLSLPLA
jgi:signal transduction histidine kinase